MAYDPSTRQLVVLGSIGNDSQATTWTWEGSQWQRQNPATSPNVLGSLAFDRATSALLLYGLASDGSRHTWEWKAGNWVERHPNNMPPPSYLLSLGDDETAGRVIAFAGCCAQDIAPSQTLSWDGTTWNQLQPKTMPADRAGVNLAYDAAIKKLVLFGGYVRGSGNQSNDLYTWDGANWVREYPTGTLPSDLATAAIGYDGTHGNIVLLERSGKLTEGTWTWDGKAWTVHDSSVIPSTRVYYQMTWDEATRQLVLLDEVSATETQTWTWDGAEWSRKG